MPFDPSLLLWLLLPLAAASGWAIAHWEQRRQGKTSGRDIPSAYFKGLNYLLNEQPDKAIEVFVRSLEVDSQTVETHLALGSLFRRRGEVERAIRIHQNLIARPSLSRQQRSQALFELAVDYLKAGLLDRAENLFLELAEIAEHAEPALRQLATVYQQEREWPKAIQMRRRLARLHGNGEHAIIAQYQCEQAQQALDGSNPAQARKYLQDALATDRRCARASIMLGQLEADQGRHAEALRAWRQLSDQDAAFLGEVIPRVAASHLALNDEAGLQEYLVTVLGKYALVPVMLALAEVMARRSGRAAAKQFMVEWLRRRPSVQGLQRLIELDMAETDGSVREDLELLHTMIQRVRGLQAGYICHQCGFRGTNMHWLCPSCQGWSTVRPITGETL